jgi:hypothetical protein
MLPSLERREKDNGKDHRSRKTAPVYNDGHTESVDCWGMIPCLMMEEEVQRLYR